MAAHVMRDEALRSIRFPFTLAVASANFHDFRQWISPKIGRSRTSAWSFVPLASICSREVLSG